MNVVFLDASGWLAALLANQQGHAAARVRYASALRSGHKLLTTPLVVAEVHAMLLRHRGPREGQRFLDAAFDGVAHEVVHLDAELVKAAVDRWVRRFPDQDFSLADAVSFEVMRRERVTQALTLDHHFATAGFEILT